MPEKNTPIDYSVFNLIDRFGNGVFCDDAGTLTLKLKNKKGVRNIGQIVRDKDDSTLVYIKNYDPDKHIMRKNNSIGLNWSVLELLHDDDKLLFVAKRGYKKTISVHKARDFGSFLHFASGGYERQFFVPIRSMTDIPEV